MRKLSTFLFIFAFSYSLKAQVSPHYSQYYSNPLWLNPALTGITEGDYRITALYRDQWGGIGSGFKTPGVSADVKLTENLAIGGHFLDQRAGTAGYHFTNGYASISFSGVRFDKQGFHRLSIGLSAGVVARRFDQSKFQTGEQWNPATGFDPSVASSEVYGKTSAAAFDAGIGLLYFDGTPGKKVNLYGGLSAFHLTQPSDPFISGNHNQKLPIRYTAHFGTKLNLWDNLSLIPNALYMRQGNAEEKMIGAYAQINTGKAVDLMVGANYRINDAIVPYVGIYYNNITFGFSYDVNNGALSKAITNANAFEFSLTFNGKKREKSLSTIPFICPRL